MMILNHTKKRIITFLIALVMVAGLFEGFFVKDVHAANGANERSIEKAYTSTAPYIKKQVDTAISKGTSLYSYDWHIFGLLRAGYISPTSDICKKYFNSVYEHVVKNIKSGEKLDNNLSTANSKLIIMLTAMGYDPTNIAGHNLVEGLSDLSYVVKCGINGAAWALLALHSGSYEPSANSVPSNTVTEKKLVDYLVKHRLPGGGWVLSDLGKDADPDITAMTIQALAPYYKSSSSVADAIEAGLVKLSSMQDSSTGGFSTNYGGLANTSSESIAQVIVALSSLGKDPDRSAGFGFVKSGKSLVDALLDFSVNSGGFKHNPDGDVNGLATVQGYYALVSYYRLKEGKTSLYDMSDVKKQPNPSAPISLKQVKFAKSSYQMNYSNSLKGYTGSPLDLKAQLKLTNSSNKTVSAGSQGLSFTFEPANAASRKLVVVNKTTGVVTPNGDPNGSAKVKVTVTDSYSKKKSATCTIKFKGPTKVKSVKVKRNDGSKLKKMEIGEKVVLRADVTKEAKNRRVRWSFNKKNLLSYRIYGTNNEYCEITGKTAGTLKATATAEDGSKKKGTFNLQIKPKAVKKVTIGGPRVETEYGTRIVKLKVGETLQLASTVEPKDASNKAVTWKSKKSSLVKVTNKNAGVIQGKKVGETTVTVTCKGKNIAGKKVSDTVKVRVVA